MAAANQSGSEKGLSTLTPVAGSSKRNTTKKASRQLRYCDKENAQPTVTEDIDDLLICFANVEDDYIPSQRSTVPLVRRERISRAVKSELIRKMTQQVGR